MTIEPSTKLHGTSPAITDEHQSIKVIPAEDLSWPNVKDDPGVQERDSKHMRNYPIYYIGFCCLSIISN